MISKIDDHPPGDAASANDMNADSSQVVVIGGGLAGLTTAFYLHRQGIRTTLLESSARLGGALQTTRHQGWLIDHGADMFAVSPPGALALCQDLGISHE
ncbi:MAG: FAD-dependent oxidoreductase, partial [Planctomycetota bacterium]